MANHEINSIMMVIQAAIACFLLFHFAESATFENCEGLNCTSCQIGWYGDECELACGNCGDDRRCDRDSGYCNSSSCQPGYFGRNCTRQCPTNCHERKCDFNTGECMECMNSYYGEFCDTKCPNNCLSCTNATYCTSCKIGWYGEECELACGNCGDGRRCDRDSGYCNSSSCQPGYFGRNCTRQCPTNCHERKCDFNTGECMECTNSYYGEFCDTKCPNNCISCTNATYCSSCEIGWYSSYCSLNCSHCGGTGKCNKADGRCISNSCQNRYYGSKCNQRCSDQCKGDRSCDFSTGKCKQCPLAKYGISCDRNCPINCDKCENDQVCNTCAEGFYGDTCNKKCTGCGGNGRCRRSSGICDMSSCKPKYYGKQNNDVKCDKDCPTQCSGNGSCHIFFGTCNGCKNKYWGLHCDQQCSQNCGGDGSCKMLSGTCINACNIKYWGSLCDKDCPSNCGGNGLCDILSGTCKFGCKPRFWDLKCDRDCPSNCGGDGSCNISYSTCKSGCKPGHWGSRCDQTCSLKCGGDGSCTFRSGSCSSGCKPGYWGLRCDRACHAKCGGDGSCNISNGDCMSGCESGYWTSKCDQICPRNCGVDRSCNIRNGYCSKGCKPSFWGQKCDQSCPLKCGGDGSCKQHSKMCEEGCRPGYMGSFCNESCSSNCKNKSCNRNTGYCLHNCTDGWFGSQCKKACPIYCGKERSCDRASGECSNDCKEEWFGMYCNKSCPVNCADSKCNRLSGECPNDCKEKWFGMYCNKSCPMNCADKKCNRSSGECINECKDGWFGQHCNKSCPGNCADGSCKKLDGTCIKECTTSFYGAQCTLDCPLNCYGDRSCHRESGICNYGCTPGWTGSHCKSECEFPKFGNFCMENCGKCRDQSCHHINGTCMQGCEDEWLTQYCNVENKADVMDSIAVVLIVVAVIILIITIVIVLVLIRKRDYSKEKANKASGADGVELIAGSDIVEDELGALSQTGDAAEQGTSQLGTIDDLEKIYCNTDETTKGIPVSQLKAYFTENRHNKKFEEEFKALPHGPIHPTTVAELPKNMKKNRYKNTLPYDHSRVRLQGKMDFINANFIEDASGIKKYIAAQGPIQTTIEDFWQMIWESNIDKIVMLTNLVEGGKKKCEQYWPNPNEKTTHGKFGLTLKDERIFSYYTLREVEIIDNKSKQKREILHYHFTTWPDHGTPDPLLLILFHKRVIATKAKYDGPILVHCSAGIGRTGTFIALDALDSQGANTGIVDIENYVRIMRKDRLNMIQTSEQYKVLHEALVEAFQWHDTSISMDEFPSVWKSIDSDNSPINQQHLKKEYDKLLEMKTLRGEETSITALKEENKLKNRTVNILPLDRYRPYLTSHLSGANDYINSVIIPTQMSIEAFMVTQLPLQGTIVDFWRLISDQDSHCIVYFASSSDEEISFFPANDDSLETRMHLIQKESMTSIQEGVEEINLIVKNKENNQTADVLMLKMKMDDISFPSASHIFRAAEVVELQRRRFKNSPCTIVSLDGCTPCEEFCAFSDVTEYMKVDNKIDVFQTARQLQIRRPEFFGKFETYRYCYQIINEYLMTQNVYCNN